MLCIEDDVFRIGFTIHHNISEHIHQHHIGTKQFFIKRNSKILMPQHIRKKDVKNRFADCMKCIVLHRF